MNRLIGILFFVLIGCAPIPHHRDVAPKIDGSITYDGTPQSNKTIVLSIDRKESCNDEDTKTITNRDGRFSIGPITKLFYMKFYLGDPYTSWKLCVKDNNRYKVIAQQNGTGFSLQKLNMKCELTKKSKSYLWPLHNLDSLCEVDE